MIYVDIEADGLKPKKIWCICILDDEDNENVYTRHGEFGYPTLEEGVEFLERQTQETLALHNGYGYDLPYLHKLQGLSYDKLKIIDTLTLSCLFNAGREGGHSLEAWGQRLGEHKGEYNDWSRLTPEMIQYCLQDLRVTKKVYTALEQERIATKWPQKSIDLEMKVAKIAGMQALNGWKFDTELADRLLIQIEDKTREITTELQTKVPVRRVVGKEFNKVFKKNGDRTQRAIDLDVCGAFTPLSYEFYNLSSRQQLAEVLIKDGWIPNEFTEKSKANMEEALAAGTPIEEARKLLTPIVSGEVLEGLQGDIGGLISTRFNYGKRRGLIEGCYSDVRERGDGRVTAGVMSCGARSGRATHTIVTSIPKSEAGILLGKEIRSLFTVEEGNILVNADAAGIQLRNLAHYMNDENYTNALINGNKKDETDPHSLTSKAIGFDPKKKYDLNGIQGTGRDLSKNMKKLVFYKLI